MIPGPTTEPANAIGDAHRTVVRCGQRGGRRLDQAAQMGLYAPPDVDLPDVPMWMIRTPRIAREDVTDRMPCLVLLSSSCPHPLGRSIERERRYARLYHLARRNRFVVDAVRQAECLDQLIAPNLIAEFQECAPSMRARLGRLWRECAIVTCRLARSCSPSRLRPITQTSALVAVDMRSDRHAHRRLWLRRWNDLWAQQHARVDCD